ncbi:MAG: glycosyltransferase family 2 protein [Acidimicrobiales bacterium]
MAKHRVAGDGFVPAWVTVIDADRPLPDLAEVAYQRIHALVRVGVDPVGILSVDRETAPFDLEAAIAHRLGPELATVRADRGGAGRSGAAGGGVGDRPTVAVAISTRDRPEELQSCLDSLGGLATAPDQVVVVDNAPSDDQTRMVVETWSHPRIPAVAYVREPVPGLARAHNTSLDMIETDLVAFTDDDVTVDEHWLGQLVAGFAAAEITCVTGMIFPAELETWSQQWAEDNIGFNKGLAPRTFDLGPNRPDDPLFPFRAGVMGSGANMAFRVPELRRVGGFKETLGAGTPARGGDDLHAFHTAVTAGGAVRYQPSAIVFHRHHRTVDGLLRQWHGYGVGLTAYLTSLVIDEPSSLLRLGRQALGGLGWLRSRPGGPSGRGDDGLGSAALRAQMRGMARGPVGYVQSLRSS